MDCTVFSQQIALDVLQYFTALRWRHNGVIASQITSLAIVYSTIYSGADQRKHQSSASPASLAFVRGIHRGPVNSPHKWPVTRKMFPFDDVIMGRLFCKHWIMNYIIINGSLAVRPCETPRAVPATWHMTTVTGAKVSLHWKAESSNHAVVQGAFQKRIWACKPRGF